MKIRIQRYFFLLCALVAAGCTIKAVGDPNRPITINAHITIDVKGLKDTAVNIEDFVSGQTAELPIKGEK